MKVLLINKFYYLKGGAEKHFFDLKTLLERHGHTVVVFAMRDEKNLPSPHAQYFVSHVEFDRVRFNWQGLRTAGRMLWSFEARRRLQKLIDVEKPDIAHIHNIYHQLSPSILPVLKRNHIPVVQTLHDYKLISPNYAMFDHGEICERSKGWRFDRTIWHRCVKNSIVASTLAALEMTLHKLMRVYEKNVDVFISPSKFLMGKVKEWQTHVKRITYLPNFIDTVEETLPAQTGDYFLFFGRLSEEKGLSILLHAMRGIEIPLKIAGSGPDEARLRRQVAELQLKNVEFLGFTSGDELRQLIRGSRAVLLPAQWYENCPLVIQEAYQQGRPVIGSLIGGIPEFIKDGETGILCEADKVDQWHDALQRYVDHPEAAAHAGVQAQEYVRQFSSERYYRRLMEIYESVVKV